MPQTINLTLKIENRNRKILTQLEINKNKLFFNYNLIYTEWLFDF